MENETETLSENIDKLSGKVDKLNSFWRSFVRGLFFGLGSAIGAGVIAAILIGALNWFIHSVHGVPVLQNIESIKLQK